MNDLPLIAGLRNFWQTITAAIADTFQLHDAAAEGMDAAVDGGEELPNTPDAGWPDALSGGPGMGTPGWPG